MTHRSKLFASRCPTAGAGCAIAAATGVASVAAPALSKVRRAGEIGSSIVSSPYVRMLILPSRPTVGVATIVAILLQPEATRCRNGPSLSDELMWLSPDR